MGRYAEGVEAERFRIDVKDKRRQINGLVGSYIRESFEPRRTYRPNLITLPLIANERSRELLKNIDKVLGYLAAAYEKEPGRQITLSEISRELDIGSAKISDALGFLIDTPASGGRRSGFPVPPDGTDKLITEPKPIGAEIAYHAAV